jgi:RND family efflux transporter MFP subunit
MKNQTLTILAVIALAATALAGNFFFRGGKDKASSFRTETARRKDVTSSILATGSVRPVIGAEVKVGARISGKVERLYANIGDSVKKDQVIAELEKRDLEAQVAQSSAAVAVAGSQLLALENQRPKAVDIARTNVEGAKSLAYPAVSGTAGTSYGGVTDNPQSNASAGVQLSVPLFNRSNGVGVKRAKMDLSLTEATYADNLRTAKAALEQAKAGLEYSRVVLSYATIKAPISGVIASVTTQEGETVAAGLNAPTFVTIIDLSKLQVDAFVDETDIGRVKIGQRASFTVDTYPDREFSGVVKAIYPKAVIQENVVNYDVVIGIAGPRTAPLRPDMTTSVTLYQEGRKGVLVVPRAAVVKEEGVKYVFVRGPSGDFEKRSVKTGAQSGNDVEIISGVKEGEAVGIKQEEKESAQ